MKLKCRVDRLERALPAPSSEEGQRQRRWAKVVDRFFRLATQATALLSPEEERVVEQGFAALVEGDGFGGPLGEWLRDLRDGWCRLPKMPPAAMKDLLLAWLSPGVDGGGVCKSCGLEYPKKNFDPLFPTCPGCGAATRDWDWPNLVKDYDRAWKELDGYAGDSSALG